MLADPNEWHPRPDTSGDLTSEERARLDRLSLLVARGAFADDLTDPADEKITRRLAFARYLHQTGRISEGVEE